MTSGVYPYGTSANWLTTGGSGLQPITVYPTSIVQDFSGIGQTQVTVQGVPVTPYQPQAPAGEAPPLDWLRGEVEEVCGVGRAV